MKYGKKKSDNKAVEAKSIDKDLLKDIKAFGSVVIIKGGSLIDEDE